MNNNKSRQESQPKPDEGVASGKFFARKKIIILCMGVLLIAAACNRANPTTENNISPTPAPSTAVSPSPEPNSAPSPAPTPNPSPVAAASATITISSSGYGPAEVTIKKGGTVTFKNNDARNHWPASDPHPSHTDYAGFDAGKAIVAGETWSFTFTKTGTWGYHDHLIPGLRGKITVVE